MPINPANFRSRLDHAKVALAGPSMNLLLYMVTIAICLGLGIFGKTLDHQTYHNLFVFFFVGEYLNMALMLFNLLPVPPLDGWRIAAELWPSYGALWQRGNAPTLALGIFVVIFLFGGPMIFETAGEFTVGTINVVAGVLGRGGPRP
jgi:Zn-dependent protease